MTPSHLATERRAALSLEMLDDGYLPPLDDDADLDAFDALPDAALEGLSEQSLF